MSGVRVASDFSHVVVGGGIVGMAIASVLQQAGRTVCLLEKNSMLGAETTSRNSEVIHAGLYYPKNSLKSQLCIEGKNLIYGAMNDSTFKSSVPINKCGKLIIANDEQEAEYLHNVHQSTKDLGVETEFVSSQMLKSKYPYLKGVLALNSPTTGIISVHDYLLYHQSQFENKDGTIALNTEVVDLEYNKGSLNYSIQTRAEDNEEFVITADNVINSAGLYAPKIANMLLPKERHYKSYFAKGTYFSYQPVKSLGKFTDKLIYPCPNPNATSLGTHLTFDMGGLIKFGPDLEWLDIEEALEIDYAPSEKNLDMAYEAVRRYFPHLKDGELVPTYTGVRPKTYGKDYKKFADFLIQKEDGFPGFVNLLGIESPGVTAAWAIAKYVERMI